MWWGEEISQPTCRPLQTRRDHRGAHSEPRAHTHTLTSATLWLHNTPTFMHLLTQASVPLPCLGEVRRVHSLRTNPDFLFPVDTSQATQVYCPKPPRIPGLAQILVFQQVPRESASRPSPWGVSLCWASSSKPGVVRGLSQVIEAFDHWVTGHVVWVSRGGGYTVPRRGLWLGVHVWLSRGCGEPGYSSHAF